MKNIEHRFWIPFILGPLFLFVFLMFLHPKHEVTNKAVQNIEQYLKNDSIIDARNCYNSISFSGIDTLSKDDFFVTYGIIWHYVIDNDTFPFVLDDKKSIPIFKMNHTYSCQQDTIMAIFFLTKELEVNGMSVNIFDSCIEGITK